MRDNTAHSPRPLLLLVDDDAQIRALLSEVLGVSRRKLYRLIDKYAAPPAP